MGQRIWILCILLLFIIENSVSKTHYCPTSFLGNVDYEYKEYNCFRDACAENIEQQVIETLAVSFNNLFLGAYFAQSNVHKPGLAKFFYDSSLVSRQHGIEILDYLNNRSHSIQKNFKLHVENNDPGEFSYNKGLSQLLNTEISVLNRMEKLVSNCEDDYDVKKNLIYPIIEKQHSLVHKIQRFLSSIDNIKSDNTNPGDLHLAEYLLDIKLLNENN